MVDLNLLNETIKDSGMTMVSISEKSGIKRETLYNRFKGVGDFTAGEIVGISNALKLSPDQRENIFFAS